MVSVYKCKKINEKVKTGKIKIPASHAGNAGSNPAGITNNKIRELGTYASSLIFWLFLIFQPYFQPTARILIAWRFCRFPSQRPCFAFKIPFQGSGSAQGIFDCQFWNWGRYHH